MGLSLALDLFPFLSGLLAALTCALLGNFLVLRRLSLMGDAISHSVLPGLVAAFVLSGTRSSGAMFIGAAAAGVLTAVLVEVIKKLGRVEPGAAMGVVFSILFALGVLLIEQFARQVDLDADCVLHGQLESLVWFAAPETWGDAFKAESLRGIPREVWTQLGMFVGAAVFVFLLFKELRIASFDPGLATSLGINASAMHFALMVVVAAATVSSFEAVGSILVIAMLICPAATARLCTDRLSTQIWISLAAGVLSTLAGYLGASVIPGLFDMPAVSAAGSMAVASGVLLGGAIIAAPRYGVIARVLHHRRLVRRVLIDDLLGVLYRQHEAGLHEISREALSGLMPGRSVRQAVASCVRADLVSCTEGLVSLTQSGAEHGSDLIRRHRLWEHYLVERVGLRADHVHEPAELLEHVEPTPPPGPIADPHGREIPDRTASS